MFKWAHEYSKEIDLPYRMVWDFCCNPSNWPQWIEQFESCKMEGELKTGSVVNAKIKNRNFHVPILITDVVLFNSCGMLIKAPLFTQTSLCALRGVSNEKTVLIIKTSVVSIFAPFMGRFFTKRVEISNAKCVEALLESSKQYL